MIRARAPLYEGGPVCQRGPGSRSAAEALGWSEAHLSIASSLGMIRFDGSSHRRRISDMGRHAARGVVAPAGAKGWLRVSMYQIASVSLRAISTRATFLPRWRPRRLAVR